MTPYFDLALAALYKSKPQQIRVMSEAWVAKYIFCPACGGALQRYENNHKAADFYCQSCSKEFELKSSGRKFGKKIIDGAYDTMWERIKSARSPNFFFLHYNFTAGGYCVENFFCVPKQFLIANIIEKRKPLKSTARRAGWVGCNILTDKLPSSGKVFHIQDMNSFDKADIIKNYNKIAFLEKESASGKNWLIDIMKCIEEADKRDFKLEDLYAFASHLHNKHPDNHHIKAKIRQQLQILRDKNYLSFIGNGVYRLR